MRVKKRASDGSIQGAVERLVATGICDVTPIAPTHRLLAPPLSFDVNSYAEPRLSNVVEHDLNRLFLYNARQGAALSSPVVAKLLRRCFGYVRYYVVWGAKGCVSLSERAVGRRG